MEAGDRVKIYHDPITERDVEGWAVLIEEYLPDVGDGLSMWFVHFEEDYPEETYLRTIHK